jgi:Glyoxalase/Bleomycin resistance protein/Dioxygenase superfamily
MLASRSSGAREVIVSDDSLVELGYFHRLGIAARAGDGVGSWLIRTLGAHPARPGSRMRQVHGLPWPGPDAGPASSESGTDSELLWIGRLPVAVFTAVSDAGPLARYVARHGTGLHSVAWTVQDLWGTETILRRRDIRITGVDLPGRHFFLHPADTSGLLVEFTDTEFEEDPRDGAGLEPVPDPLVPVDGLAWLTVVVRDAEKSAALLSSLVSAELVPGLPAGEPEVESTIDLRAGDVVVRLVSPRRPESRYAEPLESKGERLTGVGFAVADLDASVARLAAQGIGVTHRDKHRAWSDPAATLGLSLEWTDVSAPA